MEHYFAIRKKNDAFGGNIKDEDGVELQFETREAAEEHAATLKGKYEVVEATTHGGV